MLRATHPYGLQFIETLMLGRSFGVPTNSMPAASKAILRARSVDERLGGTVIRSRLYPTTIFQDGGLDGRDDHRQRVSRPRGRHLWWFGDTSSRASERSRGSIRLPEGPSGGPKMTHG